jgi:hypothetical protein
MDKTELLIVRPPEVEFEQYVQNRLQVVTRFQNEAEIDLYMEALEEGKKLLKDIS